MSDLTNTTLGRYQITRRLGHGGMATVYLAHDPRLGRDVAVKVIDARHQETDKFLKRFEREARALAQLSHPNIVKVLDFGEQDGLPYLVMEHIPGGTLARVEKPMPYEQAARLLLPIADALHYAHTQGIIHRDVKPSNILLKASGEPMLSDFGIARMLGLEDTTDLTLSGSPLGSPGYMSPEQGQGKQVDHRTDIYALGTVLYELVTGTKPYKADTPMAVLHKQLTEPVPNPQKTIPTLPKEVARAITTTLSTTPNRRLADMSIFARELEKFTQVPMPKPAAFPLPDSLTPTQTEWPIGKAQGKAWAKWAIATITGVLLISLIWTALQSRPPAATASSQESTITSTTNVVIPTNTATITVSPTATSTMLASATPTPEIGPVPITVDNVKNISRTISWDIQGNEILEMQFPDTEKWSVSSVDVLLDPATNQIVIFHPISQVIDNSVFQRQTLITWHNLADGDVIESKILPYSLDAKTFSTDGKLIGARTIQDQAPSITEIIDLRDETVIKKIERNWPDKSARQNIKFSSDGSIIILYYDRDAGRIGFQAFDIDTGNTLFEKAMISNNIQKSSFSPDNKFFTWTTPSQLTYAKFILWNYDTSLQKVIYYVEIEYPKGWERYNERFRKFFFSPDSNHLIINSIDEIQIRNAKNWDLLHVLARTANSSCFSDEKYVLSQQKFSFSSDSSLFVSLMSDKSLTFWDWNRKQEIHQVIFSANSQDCFVWNFHYDFLLLPDDSALIVWEHSWSEETGAIITVDIWQVEP
jgi:serine/threonine protein kinase